MDTSLFNNADVYMTYNLDPGFKWFFLTKKTTFLRKGLYLNISQANALRYRFFPLTKLMLWNNIEISLPIKQ